MITFKQFLLEAVKGDEGHYPEDTSERSMIHRIIQLNNLGGKTAENYDTAYSFLESDWGGQLWDKYYELFHEKNPNFEGPANKRRFSEFANDARAWFKHWKNDRTFKGPKLNKLGVKQ